MYQIPAIIFAGGKSSRMGRDKALLPFANFSTLSQFQHHKLSELFASVYLSAKEDKFDFDCKVIQDAYETSSPLVGLVSIFETLDVDKVFVLSVDTPLVDTSVITALFSEVQKEHKTYDAIISKSPSGMHPLCGIYSRSILPLAKSNLSQNKHRLSALLDPSNVKVLSFEDDTPFTNLNTYDAYQKLQNTK